MKISTTKNYSTGKQIRLSRFRFPGASTGLIVPIDHGLTLGPIGGLERVSEIAAWISSPALCAVIAHKGMVERLAAYGALAGKGVILHLNGMSALASDPNRKEMLTTVETAVRLGVDGVSVQINFDGKNDDYNLRLLGGVVDEAQRYALPVLTMLYDKVGSPDEGVRVNRLQHLVRIAMELGTDAVKLSAPRSLSEMGMILENAGNDVDIYFAGGELVKDSELLALASEATALGAAGLCVGRNVFQRPNPRLVLEQLRRVLTGEKGIDKVGVPSGAFFPRRSQDSYEHI